MGVSSTNWAGGLWAENGSVLASVAVSSAGRQLKCILRLVEMDCHHVPGPRLLAGIDRIDDCLMGLHDARNLGRHRAAAQPRSNGAFERASQRAAYDVKQPVAGRFADDLMEANIVTHKAIRIALRLA